MEIVRRNGLSLSVFPFFVNASPGIFGREMSACVYRDIWLLSTLYMAYNTIITNFHYIEEKKCSGLNHLMEHFYVGFAFQLHPSHHLTIIDITGISGSKCWASFLGLFFLFFTWSIYFSRRQRWVSDQIQFIAGLLNRVRQVGPRNQPRAVGPIPKSEPAPKGLRPGRGKLGMLSRKLFSIKGKSRGSEWEKGRADVTLGPLLKGLYVFT